MRQWWNTLRAWVAGRQTIADDIAAEMASHVEMEIEALRDRGMSDDAARSAARSRFGNATRVAELSHDAWGFPALESLFKDIRYGFRSMRRSPALSLVVILTFALGVGVNTAIFSVVHAVLLKPMPYPNAERLVRLREANAKSSFSVSWGNFQYWRGGNHTFEEMAAMQFAAHTLTGRGDATHTSGLQVTAPCLSMLGMHPLLGRLFGDADDQPGTPAILILTHAFWTGRLGADPHIVGTNLTLDGVPYQVAGVAAPLWTPWNVDYYLPLGHSQPAHPTRGKHGSISVLGRLKPGVTLAAARADLDGIMRHLAEVDPGPESDHHSAAGFFLDDNVGDIRGTLLVLMGGAILILLIACANVASLLLARNSARGSELALRKAIGAGQLRLVRQLFTENVVIAMVGGAAGVAFAYGALKLLLGFAPKSIPRLADTAIDTPVLLFACAITLAAGLIAGLAPVLFAGRVDLASALRDARSSGGKQRQAFRSGLVVAEVAITFILAFGSGLLLRSLAAAQKSDPGFAPEGTLTFSLSLPDKTYRNGESVGQFYDTLTTDLRALPGVSGVTAVHCPPTAGDCGDWFYSAVGLPAPPRDQTPISLFNSADAGYFHMMRIPLREGREFNDTDRGAGPQVAIVNERLARAWWPNESAVGHRIKVGGPYYEGGLLEIVGVAADVRQSALDVEPMQEIYLAASQQHQGSMTVVLRTAGDPAKLMTAIRTRVAALDPNLPLDHVGSLTDQLGAGLARRRFGTMLLTMFGILAMLLAAVGIYGLLSYWVTSREPEIAIRLALGANPSLILRWTSMHALRLAGLGLALGAGGAWLSASLLRNMVYTIDTHDSATIGGAALAVIVIALAATARPSWRAARVDAAQRLHQG